MDDARLTAVDDVVGPVAELAGFLGPPHRGRVGVGPGGPEVRGAFSSGRPLEGAVLGAATGDPIFARGVASNELLVRRSGQIADGSLVLGLRVLGVADTPSVLFLPGGSFLEEVLEVPFDEPSRCQGVHGGVSLDLGGVDEQLLTPHKPGVEALLDDTLEKAPEDPKAVAFPDPGQRRVIG